MPKKVVPSVIIANREILNKTWSAKQNRSITRKTQLVQSTSKLIRKSNQRKMNSRT